MMSPCFSPGECVIESCF